MIKITLKIDGMMCGMCEAHVNDSIRRACTVKKVTSSHSKGESVIIAEDDADITAIKDAIAAQGYTVTDVKSEPYTKKGFSLFKKQ